MVTGADGYQVALGWGELDPEFGAAPILLAYLSDGQPMGDKQGMARLVVPGRQARRPLRLDGQEHRGARSRPRPAVIRFQVAWVNWDAPRPIFLAAQAILALRPALQHRGDPAA